ncbi:MAG: ATP-dependent DNA helicase [Candidatus Omnitrophica bacterium CG07_land_8_20_14_0_80_50_8]|nr:MAG: hypothetical protein AUJ71_04380 [Candidatus Omnitrophica bacterium CG1_02_49_16]PIU39810.1 MAG: ATP-dependent DNA helicase [Candidatus Omnitrophica bacterium CG07_land_8_20_14_0_80_50_8]
MTKTYLLKTAPSTHAFSIDYKSALNDSQLKVVTKAEGPCLVLAGAGSGKTRTLIYRVAYLLEKGVRPEEILFCTFTNKAADEMKNRINILLKTQSKGLWCGTFHHIGNRMLRMYADQIGLNRDFGILDDEDGRDLVKACVKSLHKDPVEARLPKPGVIQSILSFSVNAKRSIADVVGAGYPYLSQSIGDFEKIKSLYDEKKRKTNHLDYDDLLLRWIELLKVSHETRERFAAQFRYCLVDEYQDTNRLQHELIRILSARHKNILVVGDDAQSIYSFRAAEIKNILDFPEQYAHTKIFKLETNYRSTRSILDLANDSIKHNVRQFPKTLKSVHGPGVLPQLVTVRDGRQEAAFVTQRITELKESGVELSQIAVLFRAHYQAAELEMELAKQGMPYIIRGGIRFFEQAHIKDVLSFLKILINPQDEISWNRALTLQPGIGPGYAQKIFQLIEKESASPESIVSPHFGEHLPLKVREGFSRFKGIFKQILKSDLRDHPDVLIEEILDKGYNKHALMNFDNAKDRLEDLRELANFAHPYSTLKDFLADVTLREGFKGESLLRGGEEEPGEELMLSTIHQAKGLEWRVVFVIRLSDGQFPHAKSSEHEEALEEERRLFYVAATRAKEQLILTHPMTHYDYASGPVISRPSIFIAELSPNVYDEVAVEEADLGERTIYLE